MEIDITDFVRSNDPSEFSASAAELGANAGKITWGNALREAGHQPLLTTPEQLQALRDYMARYGAWDDAEIAAWSDAECNAMLIQEISSELRDLEGLASDANGEIMWDKALELSEAGTLRGGIYPCDVTGHKDFGRIFFYLGE